MSDHQALLANLPTFKTLLKNKQRDLQKLRNLSKWKYCVFFKYYEIKWNKCKFDSSLNLDENYDDRFLKGFLCFVKSVFS